ncbi:DUF4174 domain-containing protein [Algirhabdus cladophorae]|uniref:DUF4174 domain-containing protein n=1 Tax=Algirhabdus cladophorae TaxID=3377108 RepID=UPI003B848438
MNKFTATLAGALVAWPVWATGLDDPLEAWRAMPTQVFSSEEIGALDPFLWVARPIVVFADSENDPRFQTQMELLLARLPALEERDVVLVTDTDPAAGSALRLSLRPRGFMVALIGKDGGVKLRKPFPWDVREFSRSIDKMPMRQQEIRDEKQGVIAE